MPANASFQMLDVDNPNVAWDWGGSAGDTTHKHSVKQKRGLFYSGAPKKTGIFELQASAGTYPYYCEVHRADGMKAKVKLIPSADDVEADQFRMFWAVA